MQPYFVLDGNICALLAAKDHVNVFLYDGGIVPDPEGIITAGHDNQTARTVAFREGEPVNARALTAMFETDHRQQPGRRLAQAQAHEPRISRAVSSGCSSGGECPLPASTSTCTPGTPA